MDNWNAEMLVALVGVVLSFVFGYFPWVKDWFDSLDSRIKPLVMAGILLLVSAGHLAVSCSFQWPCIQLHWSEYLRVWFVAMLANQTAYQVAVRQQKQHEFWAE